jgi:sec-independent protein translocase protein TatC
MTTRLPDDRETGILEHLEELRARLLIAILAVAVGMAVGWALFPAAFRLLCDPVVAAVRAHGGQVMMMQVTEGFFTRVKLAAALGIILASPVVLWQAWAFVRPGLTARERRVAGPVMPAIVLLFLAGAAIAWLLMPKIMAFFLTYTLPGVAPNLLLGETIGFPLRILFAFGLGFQLPLALLALVALRLLTPAVLLQQWRVALLAITVLAALITPTVDPFSMLVLMLPLVVLYFGTVLLAFRLAPAREEEA